MNICIYLLFQPLLRRKQNHQTEKSEAPAKVEPDSEAVERIMVAAAA